jgi:predicted nucleic acid-binding protein
MPFVLDASIVVAWAFSDEHYPVAGAALDRLATDDGATPSLWWFEVRNALLAGERRQRLDAAGTATFLQRLARLPIALDHTPDQGLLFDLARRHRLTVYDAAYLELAVRRGLMLATLDEDLRTAATTDGIDEDTSDNRLIVAL